MKEKLSILIPTYDRPDYLKKTLNDLSYQVKDNVNTIVYVNKCGHKNMKKYYQIKKNQKFKKVNFFFQKKYVGPIENLYNSMEKAKCDHVLILSDDDKIQLGFIKRALKLINDFPKVGIFLHKKSFPQKKNKFEYKLISKGKKAVYTSFVNVGSLPGTIYKRKYLKKKYLKKLKITNLYPQLYYITKIAENFDVALVAYDKKVLMGRDSNELKKKLISKYSFERGLDHGLSMRNDVIKNLYLSKKFKYFDKEVLIYHTNRFFFQRCLYFLNLGEKKFLKEDFIIFG